MLRAEPESMKHFIKTYLKKYIKRCDIHKPCPSTMLRSVKCARSPTPPRWIHMPTKRFFFPGACLSDDSTAIRVPVDQDKKLSIALLETRGNNN